MACLIQTALGMGICTKAALAERTQQEMENTRNSLLSCSSVEPEGIGGEYNKLVHKIIEE